MIKTATDESITEAASVLKNGGLVAMPTETVYGLAADATNGEAVARIFEAKGRPSFNPLIVHVGSMKGIDGLVELNDPAENVIEHFWPGPLTLILPRAEKCPVSELVSAGLPTLAIRMPGHDVTRDLILKAGVPLAAPSANISGSLSPTSPIHVAESLGDNVDMILAAGPSAVGLESTVLDLSGDAPLILRPGAVTAEELSDVLACDVGYSNDDSEVKSPGQLLKHYAPNTPVRLNAIDVKDGEALLAFGSTKFMVGEDFPASHLRNLSEGQDLYEAASHLFAMLKELDKAGAERIAVMQIPDTGLGVAINDRLKRAAAGASDAETKAG